MSAMDQIIEDEDDSRFIEVQNKYGPLSAIEFRDNFNAACVMLTGFEAFLQEHAKSAPTFFLAPIGSMSQSIN